MSGLNSSLACEGDSTGLLLRVEDAGVAEGDIASGWRSTFAYNRRGEVASATIAGNAATYAYDGWKLVLELIEHNGVSNRIEYVWGKDISGSLDGAA